MGYKVGTTFPRSPKKLPKSKRGLAEQEVKRWLMSIRPESLVALDRPKEYFNEHCMGQRSASPLWISVTALFAIFCETDPRHCQNKHQFANIMGALCPEAVKKTWMYEHKINKRLVYRRYHTMYLVSSFTRDI
tara:strand:+ start:5312 stop:5710 length:399 start_codon:yes stop_codon:yes gene_type:complete